MNIKQKIIDDIILIEGGYVNDYRDSGGETNHGITESVAREFGYQGDMKNLQKKVAFDIYEKLYWKKMKLDEISIIAGDNVVYEIADTAVNMGIRRASEFLQRSVNVLNNCEKDYVDLKIDSKIGDKTVSALKHFMEKRKLSGQAVLYKMLNSLQGAFYITLAERREKDEKFVFGWFKNRIK